MKEKNTIEIDFAQLFSGIYWPFQSAHLLITTSVFMVLVEHDSIQVSGFLKHLSALLIETLFRSIGHEYTYLVGLLSSHAKGTWQLISKLTYSKGPDSPRFSLMKFRPRPLNKSYDSRVCVLKKDTVWISVEISIVAFRGSETWRLYIYKFRNRKRHLSYS